MSYKKEGSKNDLYYCKYVKPSTDWKTKVKRKVVSYVTVGHNLVSTGTGELVMM